MSDRCRGQQDMQRLRATQQAHGMWCQWYGQARVVEREQRRHTQQVASNTAAASRFNSPQVCAHSRHAAASTRQPVHRSPALYMQQQTAHRGELTTQPEAASRAPVRHPTPPTLPRCVACVRVRRWLCGWVNGWVEECVQRATDGTLRMCVVIVARFVSSSVTTARRIVCTHCSVASMPADAGSVRAGSCT